MRWTTPEQREEANLRRQLRGFSQCKGGGWRISLVKWKPLIPEIATWSLAAVGIAILTLILPQKAALWFGLGFGVVQTMQLLDTENPSAGTGPGDERKAGGKKLNNNMMRTLVAAATLNAGWFGFHPDTGVSLGLTAPQIVQNAITAAGGTLWYGRDCTAEAVWIPKKAGVTQLLPYDASAVTFNNAVHMMREGGSQIPDEWDAFAYGAGGADPAAAIQAMIDGASQTTTGFRKLVFPNDTAGSGTNQKFSLARPLWAKGNALEFVGRHGSNVAGAAAQLYPTYAYGPTVVLANSSAAVPGMVTSLATGTGNAFQWASVGGGFARAWFNLRDIAACDLHGLPQLCVEFFIRIDDADVTNKGMLQSGGKFCNGDTANNAFQLISRFDGLIQGRLRTSNGYTGFLSGGSAFTSGSSYHVALTYDGSTVRVFKAGALAASAAATGTIVQDPSEDIPVGANPTVGLEQGMTCGNLTIDSVRISNTARYTAPFTAPTAKLTSDANTLVLVNFDNQVGQCTKAQTKDGDAWLWCRQSGSSVNPVSDVLFENLIVGGAGSTQIGIAANPGCGNIQLKNVLLSGTRHGVLSPVGDNYPWSMEHVRVVGGSASRFGLFMLGNSILGTMRDVVLQTPGLVGAILQGQTDWTGGYVLAGTNTVFEVLAWDLANPNSPPEITAVQFSTETGVGSNWRGNVAATTSGGVHASGVVLRSCLLETRTSEALVVDSTDTVITDGCTFNVLSGSPTGMIKVLGALVRPVNLRNCVQTSSFIPWSATAGAVRVGPLGKLTAIAFATPLTLDCSLRDDFELAALTGAITINFSNVTPGQKISLWTVQNGGGGNAITFGTVNGTGAVKGATANDTTGLHYTQYLFDALLNGNLSQIGFSSGA